VERNKLASGLVFVIALAMIGITIYDTPARVSPSYIASYASGTAFLQWQVNGAMVSGTVEVDNLAGEPPSETLSTNTYSVSGRIDGSQIGLSTNGQPDRFGTLSGSSFTIDMPQPDGSFSPMMFHSATAVQFDRDVAGLHMAATGNNAAANQAMARSHAVAARSTS
jgi:hypothetical protein